MKSKLFTLILFLGLFTSLSSLKAQTQIILIYAFDSTQSNCEVPANLWFYAAGEAIGYQTQDTLDMYINFGDGQDTSFPYIITSSWFSIYCYHTYTASGVYSQQYIATGPDGNADTLYRQIVIGDTCGNISGQVFLDVNGDCLFNSGDILQQYAPVVLMYNAQALNWTYTDSLGAYYFNVPAGNTYTVKLGNQVTNMGYSVNCPPTGEYTVSSLPSSGINFGLSCQSGFDLSGYVYGWGFRPGLNASIYPTMSNNFCIPVSGQAKLILNDPMLSYVSATVPPDLISGDTLIWNFSNLSNTNFWNWWNNNLGTVTVQTAPTAVIGDTVCVTLIVEPISGDNNPANNTFTACWAVRNSWDPNEKDVSPRGFGTEGYVLPETEFTYTVKFQNMGNDVAYNIFILDTLDADLDMNTYLPLASSHAMEADILPGNVLRFKFDNIMLADSATNEPLSHGWVTYKISAKSGLANNTQITNDAGIYFDFNPAVITNTTLNTIHNGLGVGEMPVSGMMFSLYPNPANTEINMQTSEAMQDAEISVMNLLGEDVKIMSGLSGNHVSIDCRDFPAGIYFARLKSGQIISSKRFVVGR